MFSVAPELLRTTEVEWVTLMLKPYEELDFTMLDLLHLDSVGCLGARHGMFLSPDLESQLKRATSPDFDYGQFVSTPVGASFQAHYEGSRLNGTSLTSSGSLIGMYVADQLANQPTDVTRWDSEFFS
jgi:hypothetical protein